MANKFRRLISLLTPNCLEVGVPEKSDADISKKFGIHDINAAKKIFRRVRICGFLKKVFDAFVFKNKSRLGSRS